MKYMKWLVLLLAVCMLASCHAAGNDETSVDEAILNDGIPDVLQNHKATLRFDESGEFRVLVVGETGAEAPTPDADTLSALKTLTDKEDPDLVLFAGDISAACTNEESLRAYLDALTGHLEEKGIYWAHVFGNHNVVQGGLSKEEQQAVYASYTYCLSKTGPKDVQGVTNYMLPVYAFDETKTAPVFAVWGMDSGSTMNDEGLAGEEILLDTLAYRGKDDTKFAYMPFSQVLWYYNTSREVETYVGQQVPALMYFHFPIQEHYEILLNRNVPIVNFTGDVKGDVSASPLNSGMFTALEERNDVKTVVCAHDTNNTYSGDFCEITLSYAGALTGENAGVRVIVVREDAPADMETYYSYVNAEQ